MSKRTSLRSTLPASVVPEAAEAIAAVEAMSAGRQPTTAASAPTDDRPMTTSTIHMPVDLLDALRTAAQRRASRRARANDKGRGGRPSVSEIVVELLERHRDELTSLD